MSIRTKLLLGFVGVSLIGALIGLVGILSLNGIKSADADAFNNGTLGVITMLKAANATDAIKVAIRDEALSTDATENARANEAYKQGVTDLKQALADYEKTVSDETDRANYEAMKKAANDFFPLAQKVMDYGLQNMNTEAISTLVSPEGVRIKHDLDAANQKITDFNVKYTTDLFHQNIGATDASILTMMIILLVGIAASIGLGLFITASITNPVRKVNEDLSQASRSLESASMQVSSSSQQLSSSSSELASSIEEMTSSLEELQSIIEANTKNVNQSELLMQETTRDAKKVSIKMGELKDALAEIAGHSKKIGKIIKVIDDIAFQTNILALNAAVEAARAGDAGKGFAVVADQVKALAQKSADAAKETADLIEKAISSSDRGEGLGVEVKEAQDIATEKAEKVAVLLDEVNRGSKEQLKGANQITVAVTQINGVVQNTASSSEENAAAGEELLTQSESLAQSVVELARIINGQNSAAAPSGHRIEHRPEEKHSGRATRALPSAKAPKPVGVEVTKPEDVIPLKDFKDF